MFEVATVRVAYRRLHRFSPAGLGWSLALVNPRQLSQKIDLLTRYFPDLASHCRILFHDRPRHKKLWRWAVLYPLYVLSEIAIVSTDLAELLGSAIALSLLFPSLPLWAGVLITGADVLLILALGNPLHTRPVKVFEWVIAALVSPQPFVHIFWFNETSLGVCCAHLHGFDYREDQCHLGSSL
jgi:hypothetical protein